MFSKKVVSAALSLAMAATSFASVYASTGFTDVKDTDSIAAVSQRLNSLGIMQGVKNNDGTITFSGDKTFTRAQAAKVFVVSKGLAKVQAKAAGKFTDVAKDNWAYSWVNTAAQYGIVNGTSETTFAPTEEVTYGQLAAMAIRTLGYQEDDLDGSTFPYNYVQKATELALFDNLDAVDVDAPATRADVAKLVSAMLDTPTKAEQAKADASSNGYVAKAFFTTVANKFGVKAVTAATFTATSASDSSLKANQFKVGTDATVYTLADASKDFSANFYKKYDGTFYVDAKDNSKVVFFDENKIVGTVKTAVALNTANVSNLAQFQTDSTKTVNGEVYNFDSTNNIKNNDYTISKNAVVYVNGKKATKSDLIQGQTVTANLTDSDNDGSYDAVVATRVAAPHIVATAPTSDDAKTVGAIDTNYKLTYVDGTNATVAASVYVTGAATKLTEIKANDVIYYSASDDNSAVKIEVVRATAHGKVVGLSSDKKTVTLDNGKSYAGSTVFTDATLGTTGTAYLGKSDALLGFKGDTAAVSVTVGGAVYGYVTGVSSIKDTWVVNNYINKVRVVNADKTTSELTLANTTTDQTAALNALYNKPVYYTVSNNVATVAPLVSTAAFDINKVVSDTVVVVVNPTDATKTAVVSRTTVDLTKLVPAAGTLAPTVTVANKSTAVSSFGDYYMLVLTPAQLTTATVSGVTDATSYGYIANYVGQTLANKADGTTVTADVYNVFEKGVAKVVNALPGVLTNNSAYGSLTTDGQVVTAKASATLTTTAKKVTGIESGRIIFDGDATSTNVDSTNVKVYNVKDSANVKVAAYSDIAVGDSVNYVTNADGKIIIVLINK